MKFPVVLKSVPFLQLSSGSRKLIFTNSISWGPVPPGIGFDLTSEKPRCGAQKQEILGTSPGWHPACIWQQLLRGSTSQWKPASSVVPAPTGWLPFDSPTPSDTIWIASQYSILSKLG